MAIIGCKPTVTRMSEVLLDGTIHQKILVSDQSENSGELIETFQYPAHSVNDTETIQEVGEDGITRSRDISAIREVHCCKTWRQSFGDSSCSIPELYEVEEVVPMTESVYDAGLDSDYEEQIMTKRDGGFTRETETEEVEDEISDGSTVRRKIRSSRLVHTAKNKADILDKRVHVNEVLPLDEVVPGTAFAFAISTHVPE